MATLVLVDKDDPLRRKFNFCYGPGVEPIREIESANQNKASHRNLDPEILARQIMETTDFQIAVAHYMSDIAGFLLDISRGAVDIKAAERQAYSTSQCAGNLYTQAQALRDLLK